MVYSTIIKDYHLLIASITLEDPKGFIDKVRGEFDAIIQLIDIDAIVDREHIEEVIKQVLEAYEREIMVSKHIESEILLRVACTNQIYKALRFAGAKPYKPAAFIALSKDPSIINKLASSIELNDLHLKESSELLKYHGITKDELDTVNDIRALLIEKANLIY